ncbi:uncharacterized protein LTR77_009351 [Saxophila tyrrhenica]|uniref:Major facilitator superfamily (MFS) profile domain-containing protein n=1 Tax=Saxophila tyrrhenica TaxID=1690608 RepID=A0AAV9NZK4_9PEZI|nr:hypothetical protein LTR77_009351 [Saxophila tyrrhenica]
MGELTVWQKCFNTLQITNYYTQPPLGLKWRSNTIFILLTIGIALFTDLFLYGLLVPILPFLLESRVGVPPDQVQSYTSGLLAAYAGASVCSSPVAGVLADKVSTRQSPFLLGLAVLLGATILLFLGETVPVLVIARVLQGVSSGVVWTIGLALCIETVGPANLGKTVGTLFSFLSAGAIWAPMIGGLLWEKAGYLGVLGVSLAVLMVDFLLRSLVIEKKVAYRYETQDPTSEWTPGTTPDDDDDDTEQQNGTEEDGEQQPLLQKNKAEEAELYRLPAEKSRIARVAPIIPCLANPALLTSLWLALIQAMLLGSCDATVTTHSRELFGFDSLKAGLMFLPLGLVDLIGSPLAGWIVDRSGTKWVSVITFIYLVPVLVLLRLPHEGGLHQILLYGGLLGLLGIGLSGTGAPGIVEAGSVVEKFHEHNKDFFGQSGPYAQLYGLNSMMFNLGLTIGPELAGELKERIGYGNMNIVLAVICGITAVLCFLFIGGKPRMPWRKDR